jgi:hypothetical protein
MMMAGCVEAVRANAVFSITSARASVNYPDKFIRTGASAESTTSTTAPTNVSQLPRRLCRGGGMNCGLIPPWMTAPAMLMILLPALAVSMALGSSMPSVSRQYPSAVTTRAANHNAHPSALPKGWSQQAIGSPGIAGNAAYARAGGQWTISGGGWVIWFSSDQFHFASRVITGDGRITAQVASQANTSPGAKSGVMFRNSLSPHATFVDVVVTPGHKVEFQWRKTTNGQCGSAAVTGITTPVWLRLSRRGSIYRGYYRTDRRRWIQIGHSRMVALPNPSNRVGLVVNSHNPGTLCTSTFKHVRVEEHIRRAQNFTDFLGVNTHLDINVYGAPEYQNLTLVEKNLRYLGIKNIRDTAQISKDAGIWRKVSKAAGVKFDDYLPESGPSFVHTAMGFIAALSREGILNYIEGGNEEDDTYAKSLGNTLAATAQVQKTLFALGQKLHLPVINMSFGSGWTAANGWQGDYGEVGNLSKFADFANAHTYINANRIHGSPGTTIQRMNRLARLAAPSRPVITTEMGWYTSPVNPVHRVNTYTIEAALDAWLYGDAKLYFYALYPDVAHTTALFHSNGTPAPAGIALHNFLTLLNDPGRSSRTFSTQPPQYSLSGTRHGDNAVMLEKSNGSYWLALWNERQGPRDSHVVMLHWQHYAALINIFDPITAIAPVRCFHHVAVVPITLADHPVLIEIH